METNLEPLNPTPSTTTNSAAADFLPPPLNDDDFFIDDSNSSTPYVSAPSSPGRSTSYLPSGFFYSAPTSPMHFVLATAPARSSGLIPTTSDASSNGSFEFEFSGRLDSPVPENGVSMSSADELFLNGQIRPMKLCAHLQRPQKLPPLTLLESERENDNDDGEDDDHDHDRDDLDAFQRNSRLLRKNRSQRRRTRSLSPLRCTTSFDWLNDNDSDVVSSTPNKEKENDEGEESVKEKEGETTSSASSSRCSSAGRSSKRWLFLKDFIRSKSEGSSNNKFWHNINISFSPVKERREKVSGGETASSNERKVNKKGGGGGSDGGGAVGRKVAAAGKRRSAHELHYAANRAQAEEMRKKTFLPYRQGLLGCLGFNSKSYGALNGFARALNPVSSR